MKIQYLVMAAAMSVLVSVQTAWANIGEAFGYGSRASALGGAVVGGGSGSYSAYHNPAALPLETEGENSRRLRFQYGIVYVQPAFLPITNIVTQNSFVADGIQTGDVDTSYKATFGQALGLSFRLLPEFFNITLGIASFLPVDQLAFIDSGEPYVPEYVLYRSRTQRPQVDLGLGMDLIEGLRIGGGLHFGFTMTGNATLFLNTRTTSTSTLRFSASLKPKVAPYFGLLYAPKSKDPNQTLPPFTLGAVFRFPLTSDNTMQLNSAARVFGDFAAVDFNFKAMSAMFYDPKAIELGGSFQLASFARTFLQLDYQMWRQFQAPVLMIQQPQTTNCQPTDTNPNACGSIQIVPSAAFPFSFRNIFVPRVGEEIQLGDSWVVRLGWAYRPSFIEGLPTDAGNYLDPSKHIANVGLGYSQPTFMGYTIPWTVDFNFTYHYLLRQDISKTPGNENGDLSDQKIGSPGYSAGGKLYGGGLTLSLAF